jgi:S-adenosylmethionine:tRNA ribosyltransferase-isomerase
MHIDDFDFALPRKRIAQHPCEPRDAARLLVIPASGAFEDRCVRDLPTLLRPGDLLVFNDTKVIPARLVARRGEATVEVTLYRELGSGAWRAFAKGARTCRRATASASPRG